MNRLFFVIALVLALVCGSAVAKLETSQAAMTPLKPTPGDADSATLVANLMTRYHYQAVPLDDAMSRKIMQAYLDSLDSQKMFFTQKDINHFDQWKNSLDDDIWDGNLHAPFAIFNRYRERMAERIAYARGLLKAGFDFDKKESYELDRSKAAWPTDDKALDDLWRKRVKNDWLRLSLAGKKDDDIRKLLDKRYAGYLKRIQQIESEDVYQTFMNAYASSTDPHTSYLGPRAAENFAIAMKLSLEGIGAVLEMRDDYTQVREVVPGGPAAKSGQIQPGDRIIGVAQGKDGQMQDVVGWRLDDVVDKIRGKKNTVVRLEILPAETGLDGVHKTVELVRKKVSIVEQAAKKSIIKVDNGGVERRIGVIDLPSFYRDFAGRQQGDANARSASQDVARLIGELKQDKVDGIIMDLRNNGGGSLTEATEMTGLFIDKGPVVQVRNWRGKVSEETDDSPGMVWHGPLAVLVNRGSASASEIFTAAIQDYGRGLVIGSDTFGKGTVQNLVDLDRVAHEDKARFGELKMTIAQFFRIDGGSTQLRGVTPDISFPTGIDKQDFGESSYKNALDWSSITPARYTPDADAKALLARLEAQHKARIASDPEWQLQVAELDLAKQMRERTLVSLNLAERRQERDEYEARRKALIAKYRPDETPAASASVAKAGSVAQTAAAAAAPVAASTLRPDDGLQADERSLKSELAKEKAAKKREDVQLTEAANIVADEISAIAAEPKLATVVLPQETKAID